MSDQISIRFGRTVSTLLSVLVLIGLVSTPAAANPVDDAVDTIQSGADTASEAGADVARSAPGPAGDASGDFIEGSVDTANDVIDASQELTP